MQNYFSKMLKPLINAELLVYLLNTAF